MTGPQAPRDGEDLADVWGRHLAAEFVMKDPEDALRTMTEDAHVLLVPALTGASGKAAVREFYARHFIPGIPPDLEALPISRTLGQGRLVEEAVYRFTHSLRMDWMIPGVPATGRRVEVAVVAIIGFRDGLISYEHLYWDQGSALLQLGLLEHMPALTGAGAAQAVLDPPQMETWLTQLPAPPPEIVRD